jgi:hypothetical protein
MTAMTFRTDGNHHFAFLQDPEQFNADVLHFLRHLRGK